jgi:hypothetical protein
MHAAGFRVQGSASEQQSDVIEQRNLFLQAVLSRKSPNDLVQPSKSRVVNGPVRALVEPIAWDMIDLEDLQ